MTIKHNTFFVNANLVTGSVKTLMDGGFLRLFDGPIPATANEALTGSNQLVGKVVHDFGVTNAALTFDATPSNGSLLKTAAQTWSCAALITTSMTFFRFCADPTDDGTTLGTAGDYRWQGTIGPDGTFDLIHAQAVTAADVIAVNVFQYIIPLE